MIDLAGRTVFVTGASSGLGEHLARVAAAAGANVVLGARRLPRIERIAKEIGKKALPITLDVTDEASVIAAYDQANAAFGTVHSIVANAGISAAEKSVDMPADDFRRLNEVNILGVFLTAREGARRLLSSDRPDSGRIVLMGSITAHVTGGGVSAYGATKAAVAQLGRNLAREWVRSGINVNVIQPGYIDTELAGEWFGTHAGRKQIERFHRRRLQSIGSLDVIVSYLCSEASGGMTGAVIDIDDGQSL